ncbi:MAG: hypothetical protein E7371_01405 [Clostridiales bacterium]|nr:hypothetical protein [Clostridiales bacterium]
MPAYYTHHLVASKAFDTLPTPTKNIIGLYLPLYFFGAQGPDFCFLYHYLSPRSKNLGSYLHRKGGYPAFCVLKSLAARDLKLLAYTLGYITHYAVDVTFHPFVYAHAGKSIWSHACIESAMDVHFRNTVPIPDRHAETLRQRLTLEEESLLFTAYSAIAVQCNFPPLQKPAFLRSIVRFHNFPAFPFAKQTAYSPQEADTLFVKSVKFAGILFEELFYSIKNQTPPPKALFGKNYLTGI